MKNVEKWSLGYELLRPLGKLIHWFEHKEILVTGQENIPKNEPAIFAPNHQNALSDSLAILLPGFEQPVFLGRADMFQNKIAARLLNFFKISPVYRIRDGKDSLDKNNEVFDTCIRILDQKKKICIYPEAAHNGQKSMLPHKKAIPRICLLAGERSNFEMDVKVVPVGIYYSHYFNYRRELHVHFGKPISSKKYYDILQQDGEAKAGQEFRKDIFRAVEEIVVHVADRKAYDLYDLAFELMRNDAFEILNLEKGLKNKVKAEKYIVDKLASKLANDEELKQDKLQKARQYRRLQKKLGLKDRQLEKGPIGFGQLLLNMLLVVVLLPISLIATIIHGWLFYVVRYSYRKKIRDKHFYSTIAFGLSFFIFPFWIIGLFFILNAIFNSWALAVIIIAVSLPSGIVAWESLQIIKNSLKRFGIQRYQKTGNSTFTQLNSLRKEFIAFFAETIA